ncbi:DUF6545 domain-containing protein [Streptomyces sp. NPDC059913]|uniref:DUF6545 domain-containing protein n=1 Tax=unclassified Streptomyces TaxID=2593676 RepID=UPI00365303DC
MPSIVLSPGSAVAASADSDFLLQRRVIEISDGLLALRPYRSRAVQEAAEGVFDPATESGAAAIEATVVKTALRASESDRLPDEVAVQSSAVASRKDLRADTEWLLLVAGAYAQVGHLDDAGQPEPVGSCRK